jgi:hypothetical protein
VGKVNAVIAFSVEDTTTVVKAANPKKTRIAAFKKTS